MKKIMFGIILSVISFSAHAESSSGNGFSTGQKWVWGITGAVLLASAGAEHNNHAQKGRLAVVALGAIGSIGVAIYDNSKKRQKVVFQVDKATPKLAFIKTF